MLLTESAVEADSAKQKLALEIEKLELERDALKTEGARKLETLTLEIEELRRSPWLKPGTMLPILATIGTIAFAQHLGVFQIKREQLELQNEKLTKQQSVVVQLSKKAQEDTTALTAAQTKLDGVKKQLDIKSREVTQQLGLFSLDQGRLRDEQAKLDTDRQRLKQERARIEMQLADARMRLVRSQQTLESAEADVRLAYPSFKLRVLNELASAIDIKCHRRASPPLVQVKPTPEILPRPTEQSIVHQPLLACFETLLPQNRAFSRLREIDQKAIREELGKLNGVIEVARTEAEQSHADPAFRPEGEWYFPPKPNEPIYYLNPRALRSNQMERLALPDVHSLRTQWLESKRRFDVEEDYAGFVNVILSAFSEHVRARQPEEAQ